MTEFRAILRKPKPEYVLGAIISEVESRVSHGGVGYLQIKFSNYPLICNFNQFDAITLDRALQERGLRLDILDVLPRAHDVVHLDVRWVLHDKQIYPQVRIDLKALAENRATSIRQPA